MKNAIPCNYPVTYYRTHCSIAVCSFSAFSSQSIFSVPPKRALTLYVRTMNWMDDTPLVLFMPALRQKWGRNQTLSLELNLVPSYYEITVARGLVKELREKNCSRGIFCIIMQTVALFDLANLEYFAKSKQWNCGIKKRLREKDGKEKLRMMKREKDISSPESWRKSSCFADSVHKIEEPKWKNGFVYKRLKKSKKGRDRKGEGHKKLIKQLFSLLLLPFCCSTLYIMRKVSHAISSVLPVWGWWWKLWQKISLETIEKEKRVSRRKFHGV